MTQEQITGAGVLATILAIAAALFKEDIVKRWRRPKLHVRIQSSAPDCHKTRLTGHIPLPVSNDTIRIIALDVECYYLRIWVENIGNVRASSVQVFASALSRWEEALEEYVPVTGFLPMNLKWSHSQSRTSPEIFADGISPWMGKHCDLGHIVDPQILADQLRGLNLSGGATQLILDQEIEPNTLTHILAPGKYLLALRVAAANAKPTKVTLDINLTGRWHEDEAQMFKDGISVKEASSKHPRTISPVAVT